MPRVLGYTLRKAASPQATVVTTRGRLSMQAALSQMTRVTPMERQALERGERCDREKGQTSQGQEMNRIQKRRENMQSIK